MGLFSSFWSSTQRPSRSKIESQQNPFKLFEYNCSCCNTRRSIQYFYRNGVFMPQQPRVVCGECQTAGVVQPFKTVDYCCPCCNRWSKARLPARPIPLNTYNVSTVTCKCGFRGEVTVGRLMECACTECWTVRKELRGVWSEDGDEVRSHCNVCQTQTRCFLRSVRKKEKRTVADREFTCERCSKTQPIHEEELLKNQGLAFCAGCGWVGYPETQEKVPLHARGAGPTERHATAPGMRTGDSVLAASAQLVLGKL